MKFFKSHFLFFLTVDSFFGTCGASVLLLICGVFNCWTEGFGNSAFGCTSLFFPTIPLFLALFLGSEIPKSEQFDLGFKIKFLMFHFLEAFRVFCLLVRFCGVVFLAEDLRTKFLIFHFFMARFLEEIL